MKKLVLLLFIPFVSFGQIIVYEEFVEIEPSIKAIAADHLIHRKAKKKYKTFTEVKNITEIKDEYIEVVINIRSPRIHLLITSENRAFPLHLSSITNKLSVYDGNNLISLTKKIDILNYFTKYGFEYIETIIEISGSATHYQPWGGFLTTNYKNRSSMVFKNNNN